MKGFSFCYVSCGYVLSLARTFFSFAFFSLEGTQLGVAKAARSPPSLPFLGRRSCVLIFSEICFLIIVFARDFSFCFVYYGYVLSFVRVLSLARTYFLLQFSSLEGTRLRVAKVARSPPCLPFLE